MSNTVSEREQGEVRSFGAGEPREFREPLGDRPLVRIHLLGSMRATTCLGDNILPHGKRPRAVLGYLCLAAGKDVSRARLARLLWDRVPEAAARTNLRQALREISSAFGLFANELISSERDFIRMNVRACWIDALAAMALDPSTLDSPEDGLRALCRGELLEALDGASASFDQWLLGERISVTERRLTLLELGLEQTGQGGSAYEGLVVALADVRSQAQALRALEGLRNPQETLGAKAPPETDAPVEAGGRFPSCEPGGRSAGLATVPRQTSNQPLARIRDRLRVGVLPFLASGSEKEESLAFSLSQEIAAALARFRWFDVIAPVSLRRTLSDCFLGDHQKHDDLDYVVDGVISATSGHIQINVRLLDLVDHARPVCNQCFDLARGELHWLNELVTTRIVARIDPVILQIEGRPKRREHYGATGLLLLAIPMIFSMERKKYEEAGRLIERALQLDPDNAMVEAWAAHWHLFYSGQGWAKDPSKTFAAVQKHAQRAIQLDCNNAEALGIYAHACAYAHQDFDTAVRCFDRSLRLNPSLAFIWALSSMTYCYIGEPRMALDRLERYRDLAPFDPYYSWFENFYTVAYCFKGDYERAVIFGQRATKASPDFVAGYKPLIASLGHLGRRDEARPYIAKLLSLEPSFTIEHFARVYPFKQVSDRTRYMRGLLLAGVPER